MLCGAILLLVGVVIGYFAASMQTKTIPRSQFAAYQIQDAIGRLMLAETTFAKAQKEMHDRILRDQAVGIESSIKEIHALQKLVGGIEMNRDYVRWLKSAAKTVKAHPELFSRPTMETYPAGHADEFVKQLNEALEFINTLPENDEASNTAAQTTASPSSGL